MAGFLFRLERADGKPAEQSSLSGAVPNWGPGHTIHFGWKTNTSTPVEAATASRLSAIALSGTTIDLSLGFVERDG
jgi:hypothetical protein